jgi:hypothetical protein
MARRQAATPMICTSFMCSSRIIRVLAMGARIQPQQGKSDGACVTSAPQSQVCWRFLRVARVALDDHHFVLNALHAAYTIEISPGLASTTRKYISRTARIPCADRSLHVIEDAARSWLSNIGGCTTMPPPRWRYTRQQRTGGFWTMKTYSEYLRDTPSQT